MGICILTTPPFLAPTRGLVMHLGWSTIALLRERDHYIVKPDFIFTYIVCIWFLKKACFLDSTPCHLTQAWHPPAPYLQHLWGTLRPSSASPGFCCLNVCLTQVAWLRENLDEISMPLNMFPVVQNQFWWTWGKLWQPLCLDLAHRTLSGKLLSADHIICFVPKVKGTEHIGG